MTKNTFTRFALTLAIIASLAELFVGVKACAQTCYREHEDIVWTLYEHAHINDEIEFVDEVELDIALSTDAEAMCFRFIEQPSIFEQ